MQKKIFIHIGHAKTGTSSIQKYLMNESQSDAAMFCYPEVSRIADAHHGLFKSGEEVYTALLEEIKRTTKEYIIISSECGLPNFRNFVAGKHYKIDFLQALKSLFDVKIIYYVRNHFEVLESSFLQYTKTNNPQLYLRLMDESEVRSFGADLLKEHFFPSQVRSEEWIDRAPTRQFDYFSNIDGFWAEIFGASSIISKVYQKGNLLEGDIVRDFIALTDPRKEFLSGGGHERFNENVTSLYMNHSPGGLISDQSRICIQEVYYESVKSYAAKYLSEEDGVLLLAGFTLGAH